MADNVNDVAAALIGVIAKDQKVLVQLQATLNELVRAGQTINVPETRVDVPPVDLAPLQNAFANLEKHLTKPHEHPEWTFMVTRDSVNGLIKKITATPGNK